MADKRRRWSPLTSIATTPLSPSGLVILESNDGEVETFVRTNIELRYEGSCPLPRLSPNQAGSWNARDTHLTLHITTHRIVFIDEREVIGGSIPLSLIETTNPIGGPSFRSPKASYKIELTTHAWGHLVIAFRGGESNSYKQSAKDRDDAYKTVQRALKRKAWETQERNARKEALRPSTTIVARKVGVDAIMTRNELRHRENANLADAAFGSVMTNTKVVKHKDEGEADIDAFMNEASELIKVIQKYVATIEHERAVASNSNTKTTKENDTTKLVGMLENMGMTSALSAKQSGSTYHKQLARQLLDFLTYKDKLTQAGGMMTLTDVYCLFNRARGTNMISPEDLLKAVDLMKELNLGLSRRTFASGVVVIQNDTFDDEIVARRLMNLATESMIHRPLHSSLVGGITAVDASRALKMSALLSNEHLLTAEQMGWLCRDVTIEGIRFFPNLFRTGDFSMAVFSDQSLIDSESGCYSAMVDSFCASFSQP